MEKRTILGWLILFLAVVALTSCATAPVKPITQADLPDLKGEWKGYYDEESSRFTQPIEMKIFGEQLRGSWTWHRATGLPSTGSFYARIENGIFTTSFGNNQVNLRLRKGEGKMRLEGDWKAGQYQGTMYLNKVK
jgi:hypothetical protein